MIEDFRPDGDAPRYFGVYPALVTNIVDEKKLGRIEVKFPWLGKRGASDVRAWATLLTPYADNDQGLEILPEKDTQVVVAFEAGDLRRPYIVGAAWNGVESLPVKPEEPNNKRIIKTRSGSILEFDDSRGQAKVTLSMKSGHKLVLSDAAQEVRLEHANGCSLVMDRTGRIVITANATVEVNVPAVNVHAQTTTFDGTVLCTELVASVGVVSPSYTPGVGNLL